MKIINNVINGNGEELFIIFGGAGFIGRHLIDLINNRDCGRNGNAKILIMDTSEAIKNFRLEKVPNVLSNAINLYEDSLQKDCFTEKGDARLEGHFSEINVFNFASPVGVQNHQDPTFYKAMAINQNIYLFCRLLAGQFSSKSKLKFWFTSSSEIYGNIWSNKSGVYDKNISLNQFYDPTKDFGGFRSDYIYQKVLGEELFKNLNNNFSVFIYRLFNVVGEYQDPTKGVFPKFIKNILNNELCLVTEGVRTYTPYTVLMDQFELDIEQEQKQILPKVIDILPDNDFKFSLSAEELYIYIYNHLAITFKHEYKDGDFPSMKYEYTSIDNEIRVRGKNDTLSFSNFRIVFGDIVTNMALNILKGRSL